MFITRATRRDTDDLRRFFEKEDWDDPILDRGVAFIAREGPILGNVRLIEIDPQTLVIEDVVVAGSRRNEGIGRNLMQAAMNSRGGTLFLCCHDERVAFYGHLGFREVPFEELPAPVQEYFRASGDAPDRVEPGHVHRFMTAR